MAIFHFSARAIGRGSGHSAAGAAAYQSGTRVKDPQTGKWHDFTHKDDVVYREILIPEGAPAFMREREALWAEVERVEDLSSRADRAQLARHMDLALPRELPREDRIALAREFAVEAFVERGMVVDLVVHEPVSQRDQEIQPHAHMLLTLRPITAEGEFGNKEREWNSRALLQEWREQWEEAVNTALARAGVAERVDHRSLEARGIDREPEPKMGAAAQAMERRGIETERGQLFREVQERNMERALEAAPAAGQEHGAEVEP